VKTSRRKRAKRVEPVPQTQAQRAPSDLWVFALLTVAVFAAYGRTLQFGFVTYDDPAYTTDNIHVSAGVAWNGIAWAFTHSSAGNWFPLTWLSHMLDCQLFGFDAGLHHLTNVCIHVLATLLLYALLRRITSARGPSAMVAALFALHPLHVESVAWIAERKDVLSAFFWMATLWAYAKYVARPGPLRYALTLLAFCLGLMAKPMVVTLPLVMLLLDYWPFARGLRILEKLPFLGLSAAASVVTYLVHENVAAVVSLESLPIGTRIENALVSYAIYVGKMFWPTRLAVFYPYPSGSLVWPAILAGLALAAVTAAALRAARKRPYLLVGWLWYLVTLAPVIGLIQAGRQARADRYTYIPMIGLSIALVWGAREILQSRPRWRAAIAWGVAAACAALTWSQVGYWRDSVSLFQRAVDVTGDNYIARFNLAGALGMRGENEEAARQLTEALRIRPGSAPAHVGLGRLLAKQGRTAEALAELHTAALFQPGDANIHYQIGAVLGAAGRAYEAAGELSEAVRLDPNNADARRDLGMALAILGRLPEAAEQFGAAIRLRPDDESARFHLGVTLANLGRTHEAIAQLSEAVRIDPDDAKARAALDGAMAAERGAGK
jgi:tetratricopeptide (TPR) repeat protein